jgi:8-oxo-dGTP pyrophosphatase MutT (NUDIX family)
MAMTYRFALGAIIRLLVVCRLTSSTTGRPCSTTTRNSICGSHQEVISTATNWPHEAALRETKEETGLDVTLLSEPAGPEGDTVRPLLEPQQLLLEDIDVHRDHVAHQHIDSVLYGAAATREISPAPGEAPADAWEWAMAEELRANPERYEPDVIELGTEAIDLVGAKRS